MINEACIADDQMNEMCNGDLPDHDGTLTSVELKSKLLEKLQQLENTHITGYDFCRFLTSWSAHEFIEPSQYSLRHSDFLHRPNVSYLKEWPPKLEADQENGNSNLPALRRSSNACECRRTRTCVTRRGRQPVNRGDSGNA